MSMYDACRAEVIGTPEGRLFLHMLALADYDCRRILEGDPARAPSESDVINALSAARFLQSPWGRSIAGVLGATPAARAHLAAMAEATIQAIGLPQDLVDRLSEAKLREAVGLYREHTQRLPATARKRIAQPSFRLVA